MARQRREEAKRIGARIAELREHAHLTQAAAAERARVAYRTYQTWEAGDATPRWHNYERLAKLFGVTVEQILSADPTPATGSNGDLVALAEAVKRIDAKLDLVLAELADLADRDAEAVKDAVERETADAAEQHGSRSGSSAPAGRARQRATPAP